MPLSIAVDCDITFVPTDIDWFLSLEELTGKRDHGIRLYDIKQKVDYDITKYFREELDKMKMTGFEFWDSECLYDYQIPVYGAVETLEELYYLGHEITFVSHVIGNHAQSKINFLERFCPFAKDIIISEDKSVVPCDIIIEDRVQNLKNFTPETCGVILDNKYIKHEEGGCPYSVVNSWYEVEERIWWLSKNYF